MVWKQIKNLIFRYIRQFGTFQTEVKTNYHLDTAHKTDWFYHDIWSPYIQSLQMNIVLEGFSCSSLSRFLGQWYYSCHIGHFHQLHATHTHIAHGGHTHCPTGNTCQGFILDSADGFLRRVCVCVCRDAHLPDLRSNRCFFFPFMSEKEGSSFQASFLFVKESRQESIILSLQIQWLGWAERTLFN